MRHLLAVVPLTFLVLYPCHLIAQTKVVHKDRPQVIKTSADNIFLLRELGAMITIDGKNIKVVNVAPPERRPPAYKDVELREDDDVIMVNGRHVSGVNDLRKVYDGLRVGEEFKLGVRRENQMRLVSVTKADPKDLPQMQMRIVKKGGEDEDGLFPAVGVVIKPKGRSLIINEILPGENAVRNADVKAGDVITSMNGKHYASLNEYTKAFDELEPGKPVAWELTRGTAIHTITFPKPEPKMMMIRREGKK